MKQLIAVVFFILLLTGCTNKSGKSHRMELVPEPDKDLKEKCEKQKTVNKDTCAFTEPDTSVVGIKIDNVESTLNVLGKHTKLEGDSTHVFYSKGKNQILGLTVHPGSYYSQVSIFTVTYSANTKQKLRQINVPEFKTESGIKLGMSRQNIIERFGICYTVKEDAQGYELAYRIESPMDSKTQLLKRNNMPVYYALYRFKKNKLDSYEFGFEYP